MAYEPPPFMPYEPFFLGVGVVFNLLIQNGIFSLRSRPPFTGVLLGPGPESAPRSAFWAILGTCLGVPQRVLFECSLAFFRPEKRQKALKKHSLGHSEAGAQNCPKSTPGGTFRPGPQKHSCKWRPGSQFLAMKSTCRLSKTLASVGCRSECRLGVYSHSALHPTMHYKQEVDDFHSLDSRVTRVIRLLSGVAPANQTKERAKTKSS